VDGVGDEDSLSLLRRLDGSPSGDAALLGMVLLRRGGDGPQLERSQIKYGKIYSTTPRGPLYHDPPD
jgi:hypothetical protein